MDCFRSGRDEDELETREPEAFLDIWLAFAPAEAGPPRKSRPNKVSAGLGGLACSTGAERAACGAETAALGRDGAGVGGSPIKSTFGGCFDTGSGWPADDAEERAGFCASTFCLS
jgi:hypothetical protein